MAKAGPTDRLVHPSMASTAQGTGTDGIVRRMEGVKGEVEGEGVGLRGEEVRGE